MRAKITRKASIQSVYRADRIVIRICPKLDPNSSFIQGSTVSVKWSGGQVHVVGTVGQIVIIVTVLGSGLI